MQSLHMIVDGRVKLLKDGRFMREFVSKNVVGGLAAMTRDPDGQHVVAIDDTITFEFDIDDMFDVLEDHFTIQLAVLRALARQVIELRKELGLRAGFNPVDPDAEEPEVGELWLVERMNFLRQTLPFGEAHIEVVADIAQSATEMRLPAGSRLWQEGDNSGFTVTLLNGVVDCASRDGAHEFDFAPLSVLGAIDSMAGMPRWYDAVCRTDIVALRGATEHLIDFMEDHPNLASELMRLNSMMILGLHQRIADERQQREDEESAQSGERLAVRAAEAD